jgi:hypothetical protein
VALSSSPGTVHGSPTDPPKLSVVVVIGALRERADRGIEALLAQRDAPPLEIVVVDVMPPPSPPAWARHPRVVHTPAAGAASVMEAKALGARTARADFVAFLEDHCHASPRWAAEVWHGFEQGADLVAYAFSTMNPVTYVSRSFLVLAYGPWMSPVTTGWVPTASWMNVAYRASWLRPLLDELGTWMSCEPLLHARLRAGGARCWQAAEAHVHHVNHPRLIGACRDSAVWQRVFAATRVRVEGFGPARRLLYGLTVPLAAPVLILARLARKMSRNGAHRRAFWKAVPALLAIYTWGSLHEALGYLFGMGDAARDTLEIETADPRSP